MRERIEARLTVLRTRREQIDAQLRRDWLAQVGPYDAAIAELEALLAEPEPEPEPEPTAETE